VPHAPIRRARALLPIQSLLALVAAVVAVVAISLLTYRSMQARAESARAVSHTTAIRNDVFRVQLLMERAQEGQRGFLLTGDEDELGPVEIARAAVAGQIDNLRERVQGSPVQLAVIDAIQPLLRTRLDSIDETIRLKRAGDTQAAVALVARGRGRVVMQQFHDLMAQLLGDVEAQLGRRTEAWEASVRWSSYVMFGGAGVLLGMILFVGYLSSRDYRRLETESWLRRLKLELGDRLQADHRLESIGDKILDVVVPNLGAQVGAVYVNEPGDPTAAHGTSGLRRIGGYALAGGAKTQLARGDGLAGQAALEKRIVHLEDVPEGYLDITSATGGSRPRELVILPASIDGEVQAVVELGFLRRVERLELDALGRLAEATASAIRTARDRSKLEALLEKSQRQAEELQTQQEELRVTNEELEQQSRALQVSQAQLEGQQAELEQINAQLEEQTASLERQRNELARAGTELQRANEYKSQFLANMSHELRTPLNSSLILAKLLADNREGNLTAEQIKFASTIYSAGNDLLTLINDILDLSKIEAGMLDVRSEPVPIERLLADLSSTFQPVAAQKQLALQLDVAPDTAASLETDPTRLLQILKNLLSNAFKFTERGGVTLAISQQGEELAFAVRDTGIGIAADQQELIFEPFRQADGATTRKFGGTGLGLSISRDLARLLGGDLRVESEPGRGSTFTLTLPLRAPAEAPVRALPVRAAPAHAPAHAPRKRTRPPEQSQARPAPFDDDRDQVTGTSRTLLVIEDDVAFARVLYDLAHELDFLAVVAATADDGLALARELSPSAIVLDVGLPDRSGLAVLDALKRDPRTRHLPVHVISGHDYTRTALEMGAVGYARKPIERAQLAEAIKKLETRFTRKLRRVLVVEDDPLLRESTARLLSTDGVETVTAGTAAEALELVRSSTFDCMVLDLELPDRSGLELLEEMARGEQYSFPPVIVYTGRSLSHKQVHELEKLARSIIIKGARSPERLLDEVTLFLHQVESELPPERQRMLRDARDREAVFEGRRILIVEDDVRNVFALTAVLEPRGAEVAIARNGREALDHLAAHPGVDLVLMDIMMPEMDGLTAMRELRKDPRFAKLPIIALTAKAMTDDRERCLDAGASDYIAKPLDVDKLLSLARVWIRK
jgi:signal transduction histidine kinase/DNA-binding response OmpR family regulator/CHASE3 domain sensor protein